MLCIYDRCEFFTRTDNMQTVLMYRPRLSAEKLVMNRTVHVVAHGVIDTLQHRTNTTIVQQTRLNTVYNNVGTLR